MFSPVISEAERLSLRYRYSPGTLKDILTIVDGGESILFHDMMFPALVMKQEAIEHNAKVMSDFCLVNGMSLAPHCKTHMSPELAHLQLESGAWAITVATVNQARVFKAFGVGRILIANQVVDKAGLQWIASELEQDPTFDVYCLVDSASAALAMESALDSFGGKRRLRVLVELGYAGGRTGCRSIPDALRLAEVIAAQPHLRLAGVETYEGLIGAEPSQETMQAVDLLLADLDVLAKEVDKAGLVDQSTEFIISAGGSAFLDRVSARFSAYSLPSRRTVRIVLRCGSYLTHDHRMYPLVSPFGVRIPDADQLTPALELWARVVSRPEAGLVILGFGKRDCAFDQHLPVPLTLQRARTRARVLQGFELITLNDHHAYLRVPPSEDIAVGDLISLGMSHPCTIFDKWPVIPVVDASYKTVATVSTYF